MKATINLNTFKSAIEKVSHGIPTRSTIPVLTGVLIEAENNTTLKLTSNDIEMGIFVRCPAVIEGKESIVLPGKIFYGIIKGMDGNTVELVTRPENSITEITGGNSIFKLSGLKVADFPVFPPFDETNFFTLKSDQLRVGFSQTYFAASKDETRSSLTGVLIEKKDGYICIAATDGNRLSLHKISLFSEPVNDQIRYIIPARVANEVMRSLEGETVKIVPGRGEVLFDMGTVSIYSRLIEGDFPDYDSILPHDFMATISVNRKKFLEVLERVSSISYPEAGIIFFHFEGNRLKMACETQEVGTAKEDLEVAVEGQTVDLAFNSRFLIECVRVAPWDKIVIGINGEVSPTLIFGETDDFQYIIMPLKVRDEE